MDNQITNIFNTNSGITIIRSENIIENVNSDNDNVIILVTAVVEQVLVSTAGFSETS